MAATMVTDNQVPSVGKVLNLQLPPPIIEARGRLGEREAEVTAAVEVVGAARAEAARLVLALRDAECLSREGVLLPQDLAQPRQDAEGALRSLEAARAALALAQQQEESAIKELETLERGLMAEDPWASMLRKVHPELSAAVDNAREGYESLMERIRYKPGRDVQPWQAAVEQQRAEAAARRLHEAEAALEQAAHETLRAIATTPIAGREL